MPIDFTCPCGRRIKVADDAAGKRGRCPDCKAVLSIPWASYEVVPIPARTLAIIPSATPFMPDPVPVHPRFVTIDRPIPPSRRGKIVAIAIGATIAISSSGFLLWSVARDRGGKSVPVTADQAPTLSTEEIVARCEASVGLIQGENSTGSGFMVAPGLIATNAHVVRGIPPRSIRVSFPSAGAGDRGPIRGKIVHFDEDRDLAILAVESRLPPLPILKAHEFRRGQEVVFIGSPGVGSGRLVLENVAARGVLGSRVNLDGLGYYQLSGSINGGNSGGPVLDNGGRVIGMITLRATREEGLGFCVPAADLGSAVDSASAGAPATVAEAVARHGATVEPASIGALGRPAGQSVEDFLARNRPETWLASSDAGAMLNDASPEVDQFRDSLRKVSSHYAEDSPRIAAITLAYIKMFRDEGVEMDCATLLGSAMMLVDSDRSLAASSRSYSAFIGEYFRERTGNHLGHLSAIGRMQANAPSQSRDADAAPPRTDPAPRQAAPRPRSGKTPKPIPKLAPRDTGPDSPYGKLEVARRLETRDMKEAATAAYQVVIDLFPRSMEAGIAKNRLKVLRPDPKPTPTQYDPTKIVPRG